MDVLWDEGLYDRVIYNNWLSRCEYLRGKAVILDASELKTTRSLHSTNRFSVDQIVIPEYDTCTYAHNSNDKQFGRCLRNGDFLETLKLESPSELSLIYADFTGTFQKWVEPLLGYLSNVSIRKGTILGITWSVNGHKSEQFTNLDTLTIFCQKR